MTCLSGFVYIPLHWFHLCGFNSKEARLLKEYISGQTHTAMARGSPAYIKLVTNRIDSFHFLCQVHEDSEDIYRWSIKCKTNIVKSCSSTSSNKTEKKTLKEIMESCQDLDILIVVCTIICVLQILCLCLLKKTRNIPSSRLYGDTHDLIRKPARILYGKKMDSVLWQISRKQPIEHDEQPF